VILVGSSGCMHVMQVVRKQTRNTVLTIRTSLRKWFSLITIWFSNQITPFSLTNDIPQVQDTGNTLINLSTLSKILLPLQSMIFPLFFKKKKKTRKQKFPRFYYFYFYFYFVTCTHFITNNLHGLIRLHELLTWKSPARSYLPLSCF